MAQVVDLFFSQFVVDSDVIIKLVWVVDTDDCALTIDGHSRVVNLVLVKEVKLHIIGDLSSVPTQVNWTLLSVICEASA